MINPMQFVKNESKKQMAKEMAEYIKPSLIHGKDLKAVQDNTKNIGKKDIVLFCTFRNERHRLSFFLEYYRALGVNHFIFVDNDSNDGCMEILENSEDISVFYTQASYKDSNFGMHWLNYLLRRFGHGKWCLTCDPDEFIVYPHIESRSLHDLTDMLDRNGNKAFFTLMLDMYGEGNIDDAVYTPGTNPLEVCPYFDKSGYVSQENPKYSNLYAQGGVRRRVFAKETPEHAPALNKTPLVKWHWRYSYTSSMHMLIPGFLNRYYREDKAQVTGCLLHFKFISAIIEKADEEIARKQHYDDSKEYKQYKKSIENSVVLYNPEVSIKFKDWKDLAKLNLLRNGSWG